MTSGWRTRIARLVGWSSAFALALSTPVVGAETRRLQGPALAAAESKARAAVSSLADGPVTIETTQAFSIGTADAPMQVLPVRYAPRPPVPLANVDHCALAIVSGDRVQLVRTVGTGYLESVGCTGLDAIAFDDGNLEIALIYSTLAPPDRFLKTPVVVHRRPGGEFAVDDALTAALDEQGGIKTIAALRRALAKRRAGPASGRAPSRPRPATDAK